MLVFSVDATEMLVTDFISQEESTRQRKRHPRVSYHMSLEHQLINITILVENLCFAFGEEQYPSVSNRIELIENFPRRTSRVFRRLTTRKHGDTSYGADEICERGINVVVRRELAGVIVLEGLGVRNNLCVDRAC